MGTSVAGAQEQDTLPEGTRKTEEEGKGGGSNKGGEKMRMNTATS